MRHAPASHTTGNAGRWLALALLIVVAGSAALALGKPAAAGPARQDATPTPTPPIQIDAGARLQRGTLCLSIYADSDANALRGESEMALPGAQIAVRGPETDESLLFDGTSDPLCLDLPPGTYDVSAALPGSYALTTSGALRVTLAGGRTVRAAFGGAADYAPDVLVATPDIAPDAVPGDSAPVYAERRDDSSDSVVDQLYAISGVILLALAALIAVGGGIALALFRRRG